MALADFLARAVPAGFISLPPHSTRPTPEPVCREWHRREQRLFAAGNQSLDSRSMKTAISKALSPRLDETRKPFINRLTGLRCDVSVWKMTPVERPAWLSSVSQV
jgi:hypothetical protein